MAFTNDPDVYIEKGEKMSYDLNNSAAAAPRETSTENIVTSKIASLSNKDEERQQKWYNSGKCAKQRGYGDFSPFYENATADYFFKCGYDNVSFVEAQQFLKDKIQQTLESNPVVAEVVNEYASKQIQK